MLTHKQVERILLIYMSSFARGYLTYRVVPKIQGHEIVEQIMLFGGQRQCQQHLKKKGEVKWSEVEWREKWKSALGNILPQLPRGCTL